jgi:hypothetical protein
MQSVWFIFRAFLWSISRFFSSRFRNMRGKIYKNCHIFSKICGKSYFCIPIENINIYVILELMCYLSCEILFSFYFSYEILFK